jgi:hypothetical protein
VWKLLNNPARRFYALIVLLALLVVTGAFLIITLIQKGQSEGIISDVMISNEEKQVIEKNSKEFITVAGTWGLKAKKITPENLIAVAYIVGTNSPTGEDYWDSRGTIYSKLKSTLIAENSPLWYGQSTTVNWTDPTSRDSLATFEAAGSPLITIPAQGSYLTYNGKTVRAVQVTITYSIKETRRIKTSTDVSWDGTYQVDSRVYDDKAEIILVDAGGTWQIYDIKGVTYPFALVTWKNASDEYTNQQFGFTNVSTIKAVLK